MSIQHVPSAHWAGAGTAAMLFTPGARLGWIFRDRRPARPLPRTRTRPGATARAGGRHDRGRAGPLRQGAPLGGQAQPGIAAVVLVLLAGCAKAVNSGADTGRTLLTVLILCAPGWPRRRCAGTGGTRPPPPSRPGVPPGPGGVAAACRRPPAGRAGPAGPGARVGQRDAAAPADRRLRRQLAGLAGPADHARHLDPGRPAAAGGGPVRSAGQRRADRDRPAPRRQAAQYVLPADLDRCGLLARLSPAAVRRRAHRGHPRRRARRGPRRPRGRRPDPRTSSSPRWTATSPRPGWPPPPRPRSAIPSRPGLLTAQEEALIAGDLFPAGLPAADRPEPGPPGRVPDRPGPLRRPRRRRPARPRRVLHLPGPGLRGAQRPRRAAHRPGRPVADRAGVRQHRVRPGGDHRRGRRDHPPAPGTPGRCVRAARRAADRDVPAPARRRPAHARRRDRRVHAAGQPRRGRAGRQLHRPPAHVRALPAHRHPRRERDPHPQRHRGLRRQRLAYLRLLPGLAAKTTSAAAAATAADPLRRHDHVPELVHRAVLGRRHQLERRHDHAAGLRIRRRAVGPAEPPRPRPAAHRSRGRTGPDLRAVECDPAIVTLPGVSTRPLPPVPRTSADPAAAHRAPDWPAPPGGQYRPTAYLPPTPLSEDPRRPLAAIAPRDPEASSQLAAPPSTDHCPSAARSPCAERHAIGPTRRGDGHCQHRAGPAPRQGPPAPARRRSPRPTGRRHRPSALMAAVLEHAAATSRWPCLTSPWGSPPSVMPRSRHW